MASIVKYSSNLIFELMILIADSGSTKCDWLLLDGSETVLQCSSMGFNPYFHSESFIVQKLRSHELLMERAEEVDKLFFYGAGCSSLELNAIVHRALMRLFPHATVKIHHDLDGAALATYDGAPHIACILGTGSNACYFNGESISEEVPALAYILGDEGSGSYYGKRLISDFFYKRMPEHLAQDFTETYNLTMEKVVENVYTKPHANVYLASFMKFCSTHKADPYIQGIIRPGMERFLDIHVACYPNAKEVKANFVGSIAYYFEDILREVASNMGIEVGKIVKKPILGLREYHLKYSLSSVNATTH